LGQVTTSKPFIAFVLFTSRSVVLNTFVSFRFETRRAAKQQDKPVHVYRLIMQDTIEERLLAMQASSQTSSSFVMC
jgi:hypothetical protein